MEFGRFYSQAFCSEFEESSWVRSRRESAERARETLDGRAFETRRAHLESCITKAHSALERCYAPCS